MSAVPELSSLAEIVVGLFPFLGRFRARPQSEGGGLELKSADGRTEIEGPGLSPALAARDTGGRLYLDTISGLWWYSPGPSPTPYALVSTGAGPPIPATPGTTIALGPGSKKVQIG